MCGNFMTRRYQAAHGHAIDTAATHELRARNDHVIGGMETNE
jgi:riboflavin biosynthesis pyrimidine reductase